METKLILLCAVMAIAIISLVRANYLRRREIKKAEYNHLYKSIESMISELPVSSLTFKWLEDALLDLGQLNHKDKERTQVLTTSFYFGRFRVEAEKRAKQ
jgi:hypothetical protein